MTELGAATALLREMTDDPVGDVSASVYETARLVSLAPWLSGHDARVQFLCAEQRADGGWGPPDGYALVPTLSATEALLTTLRRAPRHPARVANAAGRGLRALRRWLRPPAVVAVPDTIAVELVVPALVADINAQLDGWQLAVPAGMRPEAPAVLRARLDRSPATSPQTWWTSLEALGPGAARTACVRPAGGAVGCSAAATAAWLGGSRPADSVGYLDSLQTRLGGPVPGVAPITFFERAWVLSSLADAGIQGDAAPALLDSLEAALGPAGAPAADGLPPDSDDSAGVLAALARYGRTRSADCLLPYRNGQYFTCFPGERTPSVSTNAHVLEALPAEPSLAPVADAVATWLLDQQRPDGSWYDKWHASPYYATHCCVLALAGRGPRARHAADAAAEWVLATQRADGSWGRWGGTVEETAYAVRVLVAARRTAHAVAAGCAYLRAEPVTARHPALWHAKDLYAPLRVIRAARLTALALGERYRPATGSSVTSTRLRGRRVAPARTGTCGGPRSAGW
jgi:hypothetical protein